MSTPAEPNDAALAALACAYRRAGRTDQAPAALDARILAAALVQADTLRAGRQRRGRARQWRLGVSALAGCALLVLAAVLVRPLAVPADEAMLQPAGLTPAQQASAQSLPVLRELPAPPALSAPESGRE